MGKSFQGFQLDFLTTLALVDILGTILNFFEVCELFDNSYMFLTIWNVSTFFVVDIFTIFLQSSGMISAF